MCMLTCTNQAGADYASINFRTLDKATGKFNASIIRTYLSINLSIIGHGPRSYIHNINFSCYRITHT